MEYWFYHLEASSLKGLLPELLQKCLDKDWRAVVKLPPEMIADMDDYLWAYKNESFLPHGRDDQPKADLQPILLTAHMTEAPHFDVAILIGSQALQDYAKLKRVMIIIDGHDSDNVAQERARWKQLKDSGASLAYYQQSQNGIWEKKAEHRP